MLTYIIVFGILAFCNSDPRLVGDYDQLILVQHSPISSFFALRQNANATANEIVEYLREHWMIFDAYTWIIRGLWPAYSNGTNITECKNSDGISPTYNHGNLHPELINDLKIKWPVLNTGQTVESLWEKEFNIHGSCFSMNNADYFEASEILLDLYNIGVMLEEYQIIPGKRYSLDIIVAAITEALHRNFYVKCIPAQNAQEQYLLEVQICFNKNFYNLINCYPSGTHDCDTNKLTIISGMTRN